MLRCDRFYEPEPPKCVERSPGELAGVPAGQPPEAKRTVEASRPKLQPTALRGPLAGVGDLRIYMRARRLWWFKDKYTPSEPQLASISTGLSTSGRRLVVQPAKFRSDLG